MGPHSRLIPRLSGENAVGNDIVGISLAETALVYDVEWCLVFEKAAGVVGVKRIEDCEP